MPSTPIIILVISIIIVGILGFQYFEIKHLDSQLATLQAENETLTQANKDFAKATQDQNAALDALRVETAARAQAAALELSKAAQESEKYRAKANALIGYHLTGNDCADAQGIVNRYLKGARKP